MITCPVYLDNCATTRIDPRVLATMLPYFDVHYGNPASRSHAFGWNAEEAVQRARTQVARLLGCGGREIIFTSGATESNNLAVKGFARANRERGNHVITAATEHMAILDACKRLRLEGFEITVLPVDEHGRVSAGQVEAAVNERTILVSLMLANNEIGSLHPIARIGALCRDKGVTLHTDATQAVGKLPIDLGALPVDMLSFSAHKFYGPKGIGGLYIRRKAPRQRLEPIIDGGGHQDGYRSGTLPVPLIVGLGEASAIASDELASDESRRLLTLRDRLEAGITGRVMGARVNGHPSERLPAVTNISFPGIDGESLLVALRDVAVSTASACASNSSEPSHVLAALGLETEWIRATLRLSLGRFTTSEEIDFALETIVATIHRLNPASAPRNAHRRSRRTGKRLRCKAIVA